MDKAGDSGEVGWAEQGTTHHRSRRGRPVSWIRLLRESMFGAEKVQRNTHIEFVKEFLYALLVACQVNRS